MQSYDARCFGILKCDSCGQTERWWFGDAYRHVPLITPLIKVSLLHPWATSTYLWYSYEALYFYVTPNKYRKIAPLKTIIPLILEWQIKNANLTTVSNIYTCLLRS